MAIALVQSNAGTNTSSASPTATFSSGPTSGNLLVIAFQHRDLLSTISADPSGYTRDTGSSDDDDNNAFSIEHLYKIAGVGESSTPQWTLSGTALSAWCVYEFSGVDTSSPFDTSIFNDPSGTQTSCKAGSSPLTPANAGSVLVASVASGGNMSSPSIDSSYTTIATETRICSGYLIQGAAAAADPNVTLGASQRCNGGHLVFKPTAAGGAVILPDFRSYPIGVERGVTRGAIY